MSVYVIKSDYIVYNAEVEALTFLKIGKSINCKNRLKELQTGCPFPLSIRYIFHTKYDSELEKALHIKFQQYRTIGEWFVIRTTDLEPFITQVNLFCKEWKEKKEGYKPKKVKLTAKEKMKKQSLRSLRNRFY